MSDNESVIEAIKLISGALADRLKAVDRQALLDDLHLALVTVRDDGLAPDGTVQILHAVIDYIQAGDDVNDARYRPKAG